MEDAAPDQSGLPQWRWLRRPADYYVRAGDVEVPRDFLKSEDAKILDSDALTVRLERLTELAKPAEETKARAQIFSVLMGELGNLADVLTVLQGFATAGGEVSRVDDFPARYFVIMRNIWLLHVRSVAGMVEAVREMAHVHAPSFDDVKSAPAT